MELGTSTPILRIFDERKARDFYLEYLGFKVDFEHRFDEDAPMYLGISRGDCTLHLTEHHGDCTPGSSVRIETEGLDDYLAELRSRDYRFLRPGIETMPWGTRDMALVDPFGNRLIFTDSSSS
ncbi:MAG: glyoxalase superfamily protein [Pseudomonadota bacterium]